MRAPIICWRVPAAIPLAAILVSLVVPARLSFAADSSSPSPAAAVAPASTVPDSTVSSVPVPPPASNYLLHAGDRVSVKIEQDPQAATEISVAPDGTVSLAYFTVPLPLAGLTLGQATDAIAKLYVDRAIFLKPTVSVTLFAYGPRQVSVAGQVNHPGLVTIPPGQVLTLIAALAGAGGPTRFASPHVTIVRKLPDGKTTIIPANLLSILHGTQPDVPLQDGDLIYVEEDIVG